MRTDNFNHLKLGHNNFVAQDHINNKLDPSLFPYVKDAPPMAAPTSTLSLRQTPSPQPVTAVSLRSQKPSWHKAAPGRGGVAQSTQQRVFVFVAGGMTYSEMREAYLLSKSLSKGIYIGN